MCSRRPTGSAFSCSTASPPCRNRRKTSRKSWMRRSIWRWPTGSPASRIFRAAGPVPCAFRMTVNRSSSATGLSSRSGPKAKGSSGRCPARRTGRSRLRGTHCPPMSIRPSNSSSGPMRSTGYSRKAKNFRSICMTSGLRSLSANLRRSCWPASPASSASPPSPPRAPMKRFPATI